MFQKNLKIAPVLFLLKAKRKWKHLRWLIVTVRKWRFGQSNVFIPVCHLFTGGMASQQVSRVTWQGGLHPVGSASSGVCIQRGLHLVGSASRGLDRHGILRDMVNKQTVCILLEWFLVKNDFTWILGYFLTLISGTNPGFPKAGANLLFIQNFLKTAWK